MSNLDDLTPFLHGPVTLTCPRMVLLCRDHEPYLVEGAGTFSIINDTDFEYRLIGVPADLSHAMRVLQREREARYEPLTQFRLLLWDRDGREWNAGWTVPNVQISEDEWVFTGECITLTGASSGEPTGEGAAEARFIIPRNHGASAALRRIVRTEVEPGRWEPHHTIDVLGSPVTFRFDETLNVLAISVPSSATMQAHAAESWLGEPLRILFGQLVFPRLVERRFAEGHSMFWVRQSPCWKRDTAWLALWNAHDRNTEAEFFDLYRDLLVMVVREGGWESHTVTAYFEEVIQAMRGSRWVWALTMAGSIEGIARILVPEATVRADADPEAVSALIRHIDAWPGSTRLKDTAKGAVGRADQVSVLRGLLDLASDDVGTRGQVNIWKKVRNDVMHGGLVSNYTTEEDDSILLGLADLLRALTREAARRAAADELAPPSEDAGRGYDSQRA